MPWSFVTSMDVWCADRNFHKLGFYLHHVISGPTWSKLELC